MSTAVAVAMFSAVLTMGLSANAADETTRYTVLSGDTLSEIARDAGVDESLIVELNGIDSADRIQVGQVLRLAGEAQQEPTTGVPELESNVHVVVAGDYLSVVARQYGVTTEALAAANRLSSPDRIFIGQKLAIPFPVVPNTPAPLVKQKAPVVSNPTSIYVVAPGDYLSVVAKRHNTTVSHLVAINDLDHPDRLYPGQLLRLNPSPAELRQVRVVAGDTLSEIAVLNLSTVAAIAAANGMSNPADITPGDVVVVPVSAVSDSEETVVCEASWYGDYFAGRPTASGEIFDTTLMTAASHFVALHTWVEVRRLSSGSGDAVAGEGGAQIRVKINDRGPYHLVDDEWQPHPVRCIDLSEAAAEALGAKELGHVPVEITFPAGTPGVEELQARYSKLS